MYNHLSVQNSLGTVFFIVKEDIYPHPHISYRLKTEKEKINLVFITSLLKSSKLCLGTNLIIFLLNH